MTELSEVICGSREATASKNRLSLDESGKGSGLPTPKILLNPFPKRGDSET